MINNELSKYNNSLSLSNSIIQASQIVAYTNTLNTPHWELYTLDGGLVYRSNLVLQWDAWILDISTIPNIKIGTILILKAYNSSQRETFTSNVLIQYIPDSNTAYYHTGPIDSASIQKIEFTGIIESAAKPPILKCSKIYAYNDSRMLTKWSFRNNGDIIFMSSRCRMNHATTFFLSELDILPGTQFIFHADCIGGEDSEAYVLFEYDPLSDNFINLQLYGNAFNTFVCYQGLK